MYVPTNQEEKVEENTNFDFSKIDYNKYVDSIYNVKKGKPQPRKDYDKNAVNETVSQYYETFYQDLENEFNSTTVKEEFKEPFAKPLEKKKRSRFDQIDPNLINDQTSI